MSDASLFAFGGAFFIVLAASYIYLRGGVASSQIAQRARARVARPASSHR